MIRQLIWVLVALLALGIIGLMIVTPTPPKEGQVPPIGIRAQEAAAGNGQGPQTRWSGTTGFGPKSPRNFQPWCEGPFR